MFHLVNGMFPFFQLLLVKDFLNLVPCIVFQPTNEIHALSHPFGELQVVIVYLVEDHHAAFT
jgi:hypothetical protein